MNNIDSTNKIGVEIDAAIFQIDVYVPEGTTEPGYAAFFANPRYVSITFGLLASAAASPSMAMSPVSTTYP